MPIDALAYAVPSIQHTAADLSELTGADERFIREKIGLSTRYVLGEGETGVSLSVEACRSLFEKVPGLEKEVDLLICVTQTPDRKIPQNSAILAHELGLATSVASFDISLGCSGYVYALKVAEGFLMATGGKNAVIVTCDPYSRIIEPSDKDTNCIFGDAAAATAFSLGEGRGRIIATDFGTNGEEGDAIRVPKGGGAYPLIGIGAQQPVEIERDGHRLHMQGRAVFNFVNSVVPESIDRCLKTAGVGLEQIDLFALHQGSRYMLQAMARRIGIPEDKLLINIDRFGNTVSSSIPMLLSDADDEGSLNGKLVMISGFGVGLSWGTAILQF